MKTRCFNQTRKDVHLAMIFVWFVTPHGSNAVGCHYFLQEKL